MGNSLDHLIYLRFQTGITRFFHEFALHLMKPVCIEIPTQLPQAYPCTFSSSPPPFPSMCVSMLNPGFLIEIHHQ
ncbi:unnamed protein product [Allacma fusca]|uniref:Uncharacterized protein n=1 Tax=Allacma fusca TaxID=39272 RepID=A0A8J2LR62_9HEXA|nr:unnamed protein product [Allacma fusca]